MNEWYVTNKPCAAGHIAPRHVATGECSECMKFFPERVKRIGVRKKARAEGKVWYTPKPAISCSKGHVAKRRVSNNECFKCYQQRLRRPTLDSRKKSRLAGDSWYTPTTPYSKGHLAPRHINTHVCSDCATQLKNKLVPRQRAKAAGRTWYKPAADDPCPAGHTAKRRVSDNQCYDCLYPPFKEQPIQELYPELIIDYEPAKSLGFKVYRTGKPCRHGHTGWRYVSNKHCMECHKK